MHHVNKKQQKDMGVLALLRSVVPERPLTPSETIRIAELQANRLLEHFQIESDAVPEQIVTELPRMHVLCEVGLPVSGASHWNGRYWVISLSADDHPLRQRFSLMHEFKHVVDHTTRQWLYQERPLQSAHAQSERVADYFAACVLMPKRVVKRLWFEGPQDVQSLAERLQVTPAALRYRLSQLGLLEARPRCNWRVSSLTSPRAVRSPGVSISRGAR